MTERQRFLARAPETPGDNLAPNGNPQNDDNMLLIVITRIFPHLAGATHDRIVIRLRKIKAKVHRTIECVSLPCSRKQ